MTGHRLTSPPMFATGLRTLLPERVSAYFGRGLAEGEAKGKAEGEADAIMLVLQARGLRVTVEQQARITGCTDLDQLSCWVTRAAVVETTTELFG